uniref:NADH-ubiquinone oxidoreductase chain 5 n=2 Tax=Curculionoidea TaxID=71529 RepID=A0A343A635_9CUCU|nr:NADH dehydrogenase subunit 5 [Scolytinae sp. BMNH 1040265]AOY40274.1 NADH dehydrogenase subunit 5 [Curculionoidea sp. 2 KM-2015]
MSLLDYSYFLELGILSLLSVNFELVFYFDWKSMLFMSFVLFISSMILNYSSEYMFGDKNLKRFVFLVVMFVMSMMMLILNLNLVSILLGWDGLGLVSYALVIYYQNVKSNSAGMLTALSNRIGDASILMSIAWMVHYGSFNFIFYLDFYSFDLILNIITSFIILAAMTKSAQIPFSSWLPAAMAAPTPVSSLVHSSTLVTAGVYFLIRVSSSFTENMMNFLLFISLFTMFMAGLAANLEFDLKKIIALSTLSQLGLMMTILSLGDSDLAFVHLLIHALFKALLFMCAGAIIHNMGNIQDIRMMGGLINFMPVTCSCMFISNFALCGLPFMSGFYSKDLVAEVLSMKYLSWIVYIVFYVSIGLTVSYSYRLSKFIFWGKGNFSTLLFFSDNNNMMMMKSMHGLVMPVIFMGSLFSWLFFAIPYFVFLPLASKLLTCLFILMGVFMGLEILELKYFYKNLYFKFYDSALFVSGMWNMPVLSTSGITGFALFSGKILFNNLDKGWIEYYGSSGIFSVLKIFLSSLQIVFSNNHLKIFLMFFLFYFVSIFIFYF